MHRITVPHRGLAVSACLCAVALGLPAIAAAAPTNEETIAAAKGSQLFRRELKRDQLQAAGLSQISPSAGVTMDFHGWVRDTALDTRPDLAPLLDPKQTAGLVQSNPIYRESILELEDRLVVDRKLTVALAPGACKAVNKPGAVADLCFTKNPQNPKNKAIDADLAKIRLKLAKSDGAAEVRPGVTAAQALAMTDQDLLDLLLNTGERTIHQVSVVPKLSVKPGTPGTKSLHGFGTKLEGLALDPVLTPYTPQPAPLSPKGGLNPIGPLGGSHTYARDYFLTGFTYGREIEDSWEYTFANETWLTDRYYVRVDYHIGLGFGVRAPFAVDVKTTSTGNDGRSVELAVAPIDVDASGSPAYQAVGLPASKTFDGKEFVLEFKASCSLYVSIPGPNIDKKCPTIDVDYSRDIDPVIGTDRSTIGDWWLDGSVTGLKVGIAAASASLDVGVGAEVTNGRIGVRATSLAGATLTGVGNGNLSFTTRSPLTFNVGRSPGVAAAGVRLDKPTYGFDIKVTPKLRGKIEVDVAIYEKTWILGPWALGFLSISQNFQLSHHDGTVANHDYEVFRVAVPQNEMADPGTMTPSSPKTFPKFPTPSKLPK